jgi:hypothetical protein
VLRRSGEQCVLRFDYVEEYFLDSAQIRIDAGGQGTVIGFRYPTNCSTHAD